MLALRMASLVAIMLSWSVVGVELKAMWKVLMQPCTQVQVRLTAIHICFKSSVSFLLLMYFKCMLQESLIPCKGRALQEEIAHNQKIWLTSSVKHP
jgi:hypothetical protein